MNNKYEIYVDNELFIVDNFGYEYTQFDKEEAGRSDDLTMIRDVGGLNNKLYATFEDRDRWYGLELSRLLKLIDKTEVSLKYFDAKEYVWVTKHMYLTVSKGDTQLINNEVYLRNPIEVHFIQMEVDPL